MKLVVFLFLFLFSCQKDDTISILNPSSDAYRITRSISYNNVDVDVVIDKPATNEVDVLILYHGTVTYDSAILNAANTTLNNFKNILNRNDMMLVSVAYPEENLLLGDNILQAEAALLWVKNNANQELGITVGKLFLAGHSQGGYLVTRLNTMHETNGVIANAPGPLNLVYRCGLEENGQIQTSLVCTQLKNTFGSTSNNPTAYFDRSLLNFTNGFKSDILFVQGLNDSPIQMYSWPIFKQEVLNCSNCLNSEFLEIQGQGHTALFSSATAKEVFNNFITTR